MNEKTKKIWRILGAVSAVLALVCALSLYGLSHTLDSQRAAERWRGESRERFAQVSCYFPIGSELTTEALFLFREGIDARLLDAGLEEPESGSYWTDGYSAQGSLSVDGERGSGEADLFAVGGDYFLFHPLRLLSGSYISSEDLMSDRVVLDRELAWRLFGGVDLEGLSVTIRGRPYYIAGVVAREQDTADQKAYSGTGAIYMDYDTAQALGAVEGISCYELVCADPISGFARNLVAESMSPDGSFPVVENSTRFSLSGIFDVIGQFGERSMNRYGVLYPYWENAARLIEDYMGLMLVLLLLFLILPAVLLVIFLRRAAIAGKNAARRLWQAYEERADRRYAARMQQRGAHEKPREAKKPREVKKKRPMKKPRAKKAEAEAGDEGGSGEE